MSRNDTVLDVISKTIENGQAFLIKSRRENGSWSDSPWETSYCINALIDSNYRWDSGTFKTSIDWLLENKREDQNGINWEGFTWDTSLVIRTLNKVNPTDYNDVIKSAVGWAATTEKSDLSPEKQLFHFGFCYPAQTLLMLHELNMCSDIQNEIKVFLKNTQEVDGGWVTDFDSAQIIEALIRSGCSANEVWGNQLGIPKATEWIKNRQTLGGGWSGLTFPAALMFRAYILASSKPDRDVVGLALTWFLHQICDDGSCFHEPARTAAMIETLYILYEFAKSEGGEYLKFSSNYDQFLASINQLVDRKKNTVESNMESQNKSFLDAELNDEIKKLKKVNKGLTYTLITLICIILFFILVILYIYWQNFLALLFGFIGSIPVCIGAIKIILKHTII